jgi:hypothetical protein
MRRIPTPLLLRALPVVAAVAAGACFKDAEPLPAGSCAVDQAVDCGQPDAGSAAELGLTGYTCTGAARPDEAPTYAQGVPQGMVCANRAASGDGSTRAYCCSGGGTPCAFNPVAICDGINYGYQCRGAYRPESLNPAISCGQGVTEGDYINYCCSGTPQADGCLQSDSVPCSPRLIGWSCMGSNLPKGEELGANKSHADYYYLLCATPTPAPNPVYSNYCCYTPASLPEGGSCVQDTTVPGCAPNRFGFACYGRDTPEDDFLPMHCTLPGVAGVSPQRYPATLYCCDFQ